MSPIFYRYIRPTRFIEHRTEIETLPHGGICLRFEPHPIEADQLVFSFSRCRADELFSKVVAKQIADSRAEYFKEAGFNISIPFSHNTDQLVKALTKACAWFELPENPKPVQCYLYSELEDFCFALMVMNNTNTQVQHTAKIWAEGIKAANFKEHYENH